MPPAIQAHPRRIDQRQSLGRLRGRPCLHPPLALHAGGLPAEAEVGQQRMALQRIPSHSHLPIVRVCWPCITRADDRVRAGIGLSICFRWRKFDTTGAKKSFQTTLKGVETALWKKTDALAGEPLRKGHHADAAVPRLTMQSPGEPKQARVLDPVERVTEIILGLLMAKTFTGTISVAMAGQEAKRMMIAALGCNLAWGLADAVMYLLRTLIERTRNRTHRTTPCGAADAATGQALIAEALPPRRAAVVGTDELESLRRRVVEHASMRLQPRLGWDDFKGAVGVFLLLVFSTFPLVVPFLLLDQTALAIRVSNLVVLGVLFIAGWVLARYAGAKPWQGAIALAVTGAVLITAIIALGG